MNILYTAPSETKLFGKLFLDYTSHFPSFRNFVADFPSAENIARNLVDFKFDYLQRELLADELSDQYRGVEITEETKKNIGALRSEKTFTVTTGHQLCLFTGPSYFIYKIISCIKICDELKRKNPGNKFVPVYWMATEDHDLGEIDHAYLFGKKIQWNINGRGRAGELSLDGFADCIDELKQILGNSTHASEITALFSTALNGSKNLAELTRQIVNSLFGRYGLVIIDGNTFNLKKQFVKEMVLDVTDHPAFQLVNQSGAALKNSGYDVQVNPREINLFYVEDNLRERIEERGDEYVVLNSEIKFTREEILKKIEAAPQSFSPNVVLRPLYQQKILPNIVYCGGPGEIAYWLEYKSFFDKSEIHFPFLIARNFNVIISSAVMSKWNEMGFEGKDFFRTENELVNELVKKSSGEISFRQQKEEIDKLFISVLETAEKTDKTLSSFAAAEKQKVLNSITAVEAKVNKALRQKNETSINQMKNLRSKVLPEGILQERRENFFAFASTYGLSLINLLVNEFPSPLEKPVITVIVP